MCTWASCLCRRPIWSAFGGTVLWIPAADVAHAQQRSTCENVPAKLRPHQQPRAGRCKQGIVVSRNLQVRKPTGKPKGAA